MTQVHCTAQCSVYSAVHSPVQCVWLSQKAVEVGRRRGEDWGRIQEDREGSIEIRVEQDDLEDYFVKEEGGHGKEELLEGVTMKNDTSR